MLGRPAKGKFADKITRLVEQAKHNEQWRHMYMTLEDLENAAYDRGLEQGEERGKIASAKNLLKMKVCTIEQIASVTGLSVEEVKSLESEI